MNAIYGCSTDMGSILSRGRVKRRPQPSLRAAASFGRMSRIGVSSVSMSTRCQSEMRGLVTAGPWVRVGVGPLV